LLGNQLGFQCLGRIKSWVPTAAAIKPDRHPSTAVRPARPSNATQN